MALVLTDEERTELEARLRSRKDLSREERKIVHAFRGLPKPQQIELRDHLIELMIIAGRAARQLPGDVPRRRGAR